MLRCNKEPFRLLTKSSSDWFGEVNVDSTFTNSDLKVKELLGYEPHEVIGKTLYDFVPIEESKVVADEFNFIKKIGEAFFGWENIYLRKDGQPVILSASGFPIMDMKGKLHGYRLLYYDITERKQAEEDLRKSEAEYRLVVENAYESILVVSEDTLQFVNPKVIEHTGYSKEELKSKTFADLIHPIDREMVLKNHEQRFKSSTDHENPCFRIVTKDGRTKWVEANAVSISWEERPAYLAFAHDITERKLAEHALHKSEARFKQLVDLLPEAIYEFDLDGKFTFVNKKALELLGYSLEEWEKGLNVFQTFIPEDMARCKQNMVRLLTGEDLGFIEYTAQRKDGGTFPVMVHWARIIDGENVLGLRGISIDITEHKRAEKRLLTYQAELRSLASQLSLAEEQERRRIAVGIHDRISQNLAFCSMKLGALLDAASSTDLVKPLYDIQNLIKQMADETRTLTFDLSSPLLYQFGLEVALEHLTQKMQHEHNFPFYFEYDDQPKPLDKDIIVLMFQTVRELLINIIKHAKARHAKLLITRHDSNMCISVEDDGVGFDVSKIGYSNTIVNKGFGLFAIRERLAYIGGQIKIESENGCGTRITIVTPLKKE